nr:hypothetical protein CFP56_38252 [Quercus suber]
MTAWLGLTVIAGTVTETQSSKNLVFPVHRGMEGGIGRGDEADEIGLDWDRSGAIGREDCEVESGVEVGIELLEPEL